MTVQADPALPGLLEAALGDLASGCRTGSDVARKLAAEGCTGHPSDCYDCPVARWLTRRLGLTPAVVVTVGKDEICISAGPDTAGDMPPVSALVPRVLTEFIVAFDDASYPELCASSL